MDSSFFSIPPHKKEIILAGLRERLAKYRLNFVTGWTVLGCDRKGIPPPAWVKPLIYLSIPWAVSIHTVTAFIYAGLPGRGFWLTAIMAPRFLAYSSILQTGKTPSFTPDAPPSRPSTALRRSYPPWGSLPSARAGEPSFPEIVSWQSRP